MFRLWLRAGCARSCFSIYRRILFTDSSSPCTWSCWRSLIVSFENLICSWGFKKIKLDNWSCCWFGSFWRKTFSSLNSTKCIKCRRHKTTDNSIDDLIVSLSVCNGFPCSYLAIRTPFLVNGRISTRYNTIRCCTSCDSSSYSTHRTTNDKTTSTTSNHSDSPRSGFHGFFAAAFISNKVMDGSLSVTNNRNSIHGIVKGTRCRFDRFF